MSNSHFLWYFLDREGSGFQVTFINVFVNLTMRYSLLKFTSTTYFVIIQFSIAPKWASKVILNYPVNSTSFISVIIKVAQQNFFLTALHKTKFWNSEIRRKLSYAHGATASIGPRPPQCRSFTITLRHTTFGRTHLNEWQAGRRNLYLKTHNTHKRQTSIFPKGFEPPVLGSERPHTHALDRTATEINIYSLGWRITLSRILGQ
jgi:hypothetical protein